MWSNSKYFFYKLIINYSKSQCRNNCEFIQLFPFEIIKNDVMVLYSKLVKVSKRKANMAIFNIHCEDPWFSYIRQGIKPVEGRKNTHSYRNIRAGDQINFSNGKDSFIANVIEIREYESIENYLEDVTLEKALPGINSIEEGLNIYYQWSSEEKVRQYGFLGIFIKPIHIK